MPTAHTHQSSVNISNTAITAASADPKNEDDEDCDLDSRIFSHVQHLASLETNPPRSKKSSTRTSGVSAASSTESQVLIGTLELRETAHRVRQKRALENETRSERVEFLTQPTRLGSLQIESGWIKLPERDGGESATVTDHSSESTGSSLTVSKLHSRAASISSAHEENNDVMPNGIPLQQRTHLTLVFKIKSHYQIKIRNPLQVNRKPRERLLFPRTVFFRLIT
ncbi:hypothetical protein BDR26DRAFT_849669 [Obelidium mucronatum]|nr:hypothetical protein BDR26DRAFT_849669 [Obelidium mucronatum]